MQNINSYINSYDLNNDKNFNKIEKIIIKLLKSYNKSYNENEKSEILKKIEKIKDLLKSEKKNVFKKYPDYDDSNFISKLMNKEEFAISKYSNEDKKFIEKDFFQLTKNQKFLKKLISPETPYRSIYLYHGVGVGKTCSSIQISQNFKKYYTKKVLVILQSTLKANYKKQLFDVAKYNSVEDTMVDQCLGNYYLDTITNRKSIFNEAPVKLKKEKNKLIKNEYEFLGYGEFVNLVEKIKENSINKSRYIDNIKEYFDDRVIIVDEIHNMRLITDKEIGKKAPKLFHEVLNILNNNTLVLLSATPMFDNYKEIIFLFNTLLIQNKQPIIKQNEVIFDKKGILEKKFKKKLEKISSNFISYMRGENPYTFPIRLYPSINNDKSVLDKKNFPKNDIYGSPIEDDEQIKHLELIYTEMSRLQNKLYNLVTKNIKKKDLNDDDNNNNEEVETNKEWKGQQIVQISNIIYPTGKIYDNNNKKEIKKDLDIKNIYGENGFKKIFNISDSKKFRVSYKNDEELILKDKLEKYSPKINKIVDYIKNSDGIVLVYSRYLYSGIIPLAIALEHLGYNKYGGNSILENNTSKKNNKNYVIISGNNKLSPNNDKEINICTLKENKDGNNIKVIIISESGTEGIDLKNIREVHILDPWYNLNRIEQVIGRAVRNYSHFDLDKEKRNTTIYQYVNLTRNNEVESIDFRTYRIAENKQLFISKIERKMKKNSIDCNLNNEVSSFKDINRNLIPSQKKNNKLVEIKSHNISDRSFSRICDYMRKCEIECNKNITFDKKTNKLDKSTYNKESLDYDIQVIKQYIIRFYKINNIANITDLINELDIKNKEILYLALNDMINNKLLFKNSNNRLGYLIYRGNNYIFQPSDIEDEKILLNERVREKINRPRKIDITNIDTIEKKIPKRTKIVKTEVILNYNDILNNDIQNIINLLLLDDNEIEDYSEYIWDIYVDSLSENNLLELYNNIYKNRYNKENLNNLIKSLDKSLLIFKDKDNSDKIVAFYNHFKKNDKGFLCIENDKLVNCSPIQIKNYKKQLKPKIDKLKKIDFPIISKKNKLESYYAFMDYNKKTNEIIFKIKDLNKINENKSVKGSECISGTSNIKIEQFIEKFIKIFDEDIIKDEYINGIKENGRKIKYKKQNLCLIYQLVLRKMTNEQKKLYILRPFEKQQFK